MHSQFAVRVRVFEGPEYLRQKGLEVVDNATFTDVQSVAVVVGRIANIDVEFSVLEPDAERKDGTPSRFPVLFEMKRTEAVFPQERTGTAVFGDVVVPVFFLACNEFFAAKFRRGLGEIRSLRERYEVPVVEENPVVTAPRTIVDAFEREIRIELDDGLAAGEDFDSSRYVSAHVSWIGGRPQVPFYPVGLGANDRLLVSEGLAFARVDDRITEGADALVGDFDIVAGFDQTGIRGTPEGDDITGLKGDPA